METTSAQRRPSFSEALRELPVGKRIWVVTRLILFAVLFLLAIIGPIFEPDFAPRIEEKKRYIEKFYGLPLLAPAYVAYAYVRVLARSKMLFRQMLSRNNLLSAPWTRIALFYGQLLWLILAGLALIIHAAAYLLVYAGAVY